MALPLPVDCLAREIADAGKLWTDCWAVAVKLDEEAVLVSNRVMIMIPQLDAEDLNMANHPSRTG